MVSPLRLVRQAERHEALREVRRRLEDRHQTLAEAIHERKLYFRVSVVGACNLSCIFCHNEGAPTAGKLEPEMVRAAVRSAAAVGFARVQFTGGEPLIHPQLDDLIRIAREYVEDVGVTTNGTYLPKRLNGLIAAGLQRLHVSLQTESLTDGDSAEWASPQWLVPTVETAAEGAFNLRLNLPVPADSLGQAERFLELLTARSVSCKVFSILPEGGLTEDSYPLDDLESIVNRVNNANAGSPSAGRAELRGFRPPSGFRCATCRDKVRCKEQSHSLRLGADLTLRPCLATRAWDLPLAWPIHLQDLEVAVLEQSLLALDYRW